jgi:HEAT repeat protein
MFTRKWNIKKILRNAGSDGVVKSYGDKAVKSLLGMLRDEEPSVSRAAIEALGKLKDLRAAEPLVTLLGGSMGGPAVSALVNIGPPAVGPLVKALKDGDPNVRRLASGALNQIGWKPESDEEKITYLITKGQFDALRSFGANAVDPLIKLLVDNPSDPKVVEALVDIGIPSVDALLSALKNESSFVKEKAAEALGKIRDTRSIKSLITILKDNDPNVRKASIDALVEMGNVEVVEPLISALKDRYPVVRMAAINAIAGIHDFRIVEPLIALALEESDPIIKQAAISTAISLKPLIIDFIGGDSHFREAATKSLKKIEEIIEAEREKIRLEEEKRIREKEETRIIVEEGARIRREKQQEEIYRLTEELISIGIQIGYLSMEDDNAFDERHRNIRARQIGMRLNEMGGIELMREVGLVVGEVLGKGRELEVAWGYIGNWLP